MTADEWLKAYDRAFQNHAKVMNLKPLAWGATIPLPPAQMEARRLSQHSASVLDYGCSRGFLTVAMREEGVNATGVDPSPAAIRFAKQNLGGKHQDAFVQMTEDELADAGGDFKFECVIATEILELVQDPARTLGVLWNRVKDNGLLVASFPRTEGQHRVKKFSRDEVQKIANVIDPDYPMRIVETDNEYILTAEKDRIVLKYAYVVSPTATVEQILDWESERRFKTGVTNWMRIFHGQVLRLEDLDPDAFDVVHVQLAGDSQDFPMLIRERLGEDSKTKLMINLDYSIERWQVSWGMGPELLIRQMQMADIVFSQTHRTARFLSQVLQRKVPVLPHPVETNKLKAWATPVTGRPKGDICINTHYDNQHYLPYWITRNWGVRTHLVGFLDGDSPYGRDNVHRYYTHVHPRDGCQVMVQQVYRACYAAFDHYTHNVQGRTTIEFAGLGIPCLGWDCVDAQVHCFPDLTFPVGDVASHREVFERLMTDDEFYEEVAVKAMDACEEYNYENSKRKFLEAVNGTGTDGSPASTSELLPEVDGSEQGEAPDRDAEASGSPLHAEAETVRP